jgi:hypothetical protein
MIVKRKMIDVTPLAKVVAVALEALTMSVSIEVMSGSG